MSSVLALGLDPHFVDFRSMPNLTPELVRAFIDSQVQQIRALGYETESCLVDSGQTAEAALAETLRGRKFDCVMIGAGRLRKPPIGLWSPWPGTVPALRRARL